MALKALEKQAALQAKYFGVYWGSESEGLCPAGIVAKSRGVEFSLENDVYVHPYDQATLEITSKALNDVSNWFRYKSVMRYLDALEVEGQKVMERVNYGNNDIGNQPIPA